MFKLRRRAKPETKSAQLTRPGQASDESPATYEFVASFNAALTSKDDDSGIYTMCPDDSFAVLRDSKEPNAKETTRSNVAAATRVPKVIAVMLEPDGQSRFFHPEASRLAGRPIWQPLRRIEH